MHPRGGSRGSGLAILNQNRTYLSPYSVVRGTPGLDFVKFREGGEGRRRGEGHGIQGMGSRAWDPENDVENDTDNEAENDVENETEKKDAFCKIPITPGWHEPQSQPRGKGAPGPAQQTPGGCRSRRAHPCLAEFFERSLFPTILLLLIRVCEKKKRNQSVAGRWSAREAASAASGGLTLLSFTQHCWGCGGHLYPCSV